MRTYSEFPWATVLTGRAQRLAEWGLPSLGIYPKKLRNWDFPGPVVKTQHFHCGGSGLIPGQGTKTPYASRTEKLKLAPCMNIYSSFIQNCSKPETQMSLNRRMDDKLWNIHTPRTAREQVGLQHGLVPHPRRQSSQRLDRGGGWGEAVRGRP